MLVSPAIKESKEECKEEEMGAKKEVEEVTTQIKGESLDMEIIV